jgi:hypothetical protein
MRQEKIKKKGGQTILFNKILLGLGNWTTYSIEKEE